MRKTIYAKIVDTFLGNGIEVRGIEDILISNSCGKELSKREYEGEHQNCNVIWEN